MQDIRYRPFARLMNFLEERTMKPDPIISKVRRERLAILESFNGDFEKMSRDVMKRQWQSGHKVVSRPKRKPLPDAEPNAYPPQGK